MGVWPCLGRALSGAAAERATDLREGRKVRAAIYRLLQPGEISTLGEGRNKHKHCIRVRCYIR